MALVATGVGAAAGAGLIGTTVAGTATVAGVAASTFTTIGALAGVAASVLSVGAGLTAKKPSATSTGSPDQFSADPQGYVPYIIGRTATRGSIAFRRAWDTPIKGDNDRQSFVAILSLGPVQGIESFTSDKDAVTFDGSGQAIGTYSGWMWQTRQLGACPEPAALGFGALAGTPPGWGADRKLSGLAAATWTLRFDTKGDHYQNGVPAPRWVVQGAKVYDPRLDSTYPGGLGPQRADNEATWAYSTNPYLHGLTWCIGRHQNGQRVMGVGAPLAGIDVAAFVEGANVADLNGWKVAGVVYSGDDRWDVLKKILQAGMGEPMQLGAMISCFVNAPKVVLATVELADVVGDASVAGTQSRRDRVNGIVPRYWQEQNDWQFLPGTAVRVPAHEAEDGGRRTKTVDYAFIPSDGLGPDGGDKQIAVACRYDIENGREFGPITLPLRLRWIGYKPGDCIAVNHPEVGLVNQPVLLLNRDFDPSTAIVTFTARSETNGKHAFALGQTSEPPPTPGVSGPPLVPVPGADAWHITATAIVFEGNQIPAIVISGQVDSPVAEAIVFEYRPFITGQPADQGWTGATTLPPTARQAIINVVASGEQYEAAVSYQRNGRVGARRILGPEAAGQLVIDWGNVGGDGKPEDNATVGAPAGTFVAGILAEDLVDGVREMLENGGVAPSKLAPNLAQDIENIIWNTLRGVTVQDRNLRREHEATAEKFDQEATSRETLEVKVDDNYATFLQENAVRISETTALATQTTDISVTLGQAQADLITEITTRATENEATSSRIDQQDARLGDAEAQIVEDRTASVTRDEANVTLINGVSARLNDFNGTGQSIEGRVTAAFTAVSNEAGARADAITQVTTSFNGQISGVQQSLSSVVDRVGNVESRWTVQVQAAGGHMAAAGLYSSSGQPSEFAVLADRFFLINTDGSGTSPFAVIDGQTYIKSAAIQDGVVGTLKIGANAVTVSGGASRDNSASTPGSGSPQTILSTSVTFAFPAEVLLIGFINQTYSSDAIGQAYSLFISMNGTNIVNAGGAALNETPNVPMRVTVGAGTYTFNLIWTGATTITARNAGLFFFAKYR